MIFIVCFNDEWNRSISRFVCCLYGTVDFLSIPSAFVTLLNTSPVNCLPQSVRTILGAPCLHTMSLTNVSATDSAVISLSGDASTHLVLWSASVNIHLFPLSVFGSGPTISIATHSKGDDGLYVSFNKPYCTLVFFVSWQSLHDLIYLLISLHIL